MTAGGSTQKARLAEFGRRRTVNRTIQKSNTEQAAVRMGETNQVSTMGTIPCVWGEGRQVKIMLQESGERL